MNFLQRAKNLLKRSSGIEHESLKYIIENAYGYDNRISTEAIVNHLNSSGYEIKINNWQRDVLEYFKDKKSGVMSTIRGLYIPKDIKEAEYARKWLSTRIKKEIEHLDNICLMIEEFKQKKT